MIRTTSIDLLQDFSGKMCTQDHSHQPVAGSVRVRNQTIKVSQFTASYCRGFAMAVARSLTKGAPPHVPEALTFPTVADPPLTRKRRKTAVGPNPHVAHVGIRRRPPEASAVLPAAKRRIRRGSHQMPVLPADLDQAAWSAALRAIGGAAPRTGPCAMDEASPGYQQLQALLHQRKIIKVFTSKNVGQYQSPIGAPSTGMAPWRLSLGQLEASDASVQILALEEWETLPRAALHAKCTPPNVPCY